MPARQPFTALCRIAAQERCAGRADLHVHTTFSDGLYTPAEVLDLAQRCGLGAIAVTDHDTVSGIESARIAAGDRVELVAGVELTAEHADREIHLLGYFFQPDDPALVAALDRLKSHRVGRFLAMAERLRGLGVALQQEDLDAPVAATSLGRRHLAELVVKAGRAGTVREAFTRYLHDGGRATVPKLRLPVAEAIALVCQAGGVAAWAHPSYDGTREDLAVLKGLGLEAVEVDYPGSRPGWARRLRAWAAELDLAVTGGSDCHGPGQHRSALGARGVTWDELQRLRAKACR